jgi:N-acyl-D-aspartate/D-glutamate deacylase
VPIFAALLGAEQSRRRELFENPEWIAQARSELDEGRFTDPRWETMVVSETSQPGLLGRRIVDIASEAAIHPFDVLIQIALAEELATRFSATFANDDEDGVLELLRADGCVLGLSDAGAHVGQLCDASMPTDYLANWVRDRSVASLEHGIRRLTGEPADLLGLPGRGYVAPGFFADIVVLDWERLDPGPLRRVSDLPGGCERLVSDAPQGVVHVVVNGVPIRLDERMVSELPALPGQLLTAVPPSGRAAAPRASVPGSASHSNRGIEA